MAVSCTEADQVRLGSSKTSNVSASSLILPFPAFANWTRRCWGVTARDKGRRKMDANSINFMVTVVSLVGDVSDFSHCSYSTGSHD
jgi:hypothetical protein